MQRQLGCLRRDAEHLMNNYFQLQLSRTVLQPVNILTGSKTPRIPRVSPVLGFPVVLAVSRRSGVHMHGKDLRSSHAGQVVVTLSISDASPPLFTCIEVKCPVFPGQWTDIALLFFVFAWLEQKLKWFPLFRFTDLVRFVVCLLQIVSVYFFFRMWEVLGHRLQN